MNFKKQPMRLLRRDQFACCLSLLLLLLMLLQFQSSLCLADLVNNAKFAKSHHQLNPLSSHGSFKGINNNHDHKTDDATLAAEKRKVYTGPNPLHNR
ncbi:hypothetical protein CISIN_1g039550mg [Citrus sinensis]|uniref:Uncharacterized protein n=1 Tax=Citrus sinensis TaxID=2711 RepID=A0A067EEX0_CITSI|nr:hypothetical protein CISIN_1g039550mg [Citrus sinensis]